MTPDRGLRPGSAVENFLCGAGSAELYICLFHVGDEPYGETGFLEAVCRPFHCSLEELAASTSAAPECGHSLPTVRVESFGLGLCHILLPKTPVTGCKFDSLRRAS